MEENKFSPVLNFLREQPNSSSKDIFNALQSKQSYATVKRILVQLLSENLILKHGAGRASKYSCSPHFQLLYPLNSDAYFSKEIDERVILKSYNPKLVMEILPTVNLFLNWS